MHIAMVYGRFAPDSGLDDTDVLAEVEWVSRALARLGHTSVPIQIGPDEPDDWSTLRSADVHLAFNLTDSIDGRNELQVVAPALLERIGIPYTGSSSEALRRTIDRLLTKRVLAEHSIASPPLRDVPWLEAHSDDSSDRFPRCIAKPSDGSASMGIDDGSVLRSGEDAERFLRSGGRQAMERGELFVESFIDGREFAVSLLDGPEGVEILPPAEIRFDRYPKGKPRIVGYAAKWHRDSFEYHHTPRRFTFPARDAEILQRVRKIAISCWDAFDLAGYARVDLRVDRSGEPWVIDVNANPCLSPNAGFAATVRRAGYRFDQVVARIVDAALERHGKAKAQPSQGSQGFAESSEHTPFESRR